MSADDELIDRDTPAWLISLLLHIVLFSGLAAVSLTVQPKSPAVIVVNTLDDEEPVDFEPVVDLESLGEQPNKGLPRQATDLTIAPEPSLVDASASHEPAVEDVLSAASWSQERFEPSEPSADDLFEPLFVRPCSVEASTTATGALDRLTLEIVASLEHRSTVVCWVFDQSLSLARQRMEIAARLDRVAQEIDVTPRAKANDLLNLVYGYGKQVTRVSKEPDRDISQVSTAIRHIPVDESGVEMTFTGIEQAAREAVALRSRLSPAGLNMMVIVFTDEAGDDQQLTDRVAAFCTRSQVRVYAVGVPAPFGQQAVQFKFKEFDPQYADVEAWAQVDQGPESRFPEVVRILMGGALDAPLDSGFGPFSLCKLCGATGGIYFAVHPDRTRSDQVSRKDSAPMAAHLRTFFDPAVMRSYRPIYVTDQALRKEINANAAKQALVRAAEHTSSRPLAGLSRHVMRFEATDQARLIRDLSETQKESASLEPRIDELLRILEAGRRDRAAIPSDERRWRAGYDLALGRTLAVKARTIGYNIMLAEAKTKKFANDRNNTWLLERIEPGNGTTLDSRLRKVIQEARTLLEGVVREHPGTPWALIAAEELQTPLGYAWREAYTPPPPPPPEVAAAPSAPPPPRPRKDDEQRELPKPKPRTLPTKI